MEPPRSPKTFSVFSKLFSARKSAGNARKEALVEPWKSTPPSVQLESPVTFTLLHHFYFPCPLLPHHQSRLSRICQNISHRRLLTPHARRFLVCYCRTNYHCLWCPPPTTSIPHNDMCRVQGLMHVTVIVLQRFCCRHITAALFRSSNIDSLKLKSICPRESVTA